MSLSRDAIVFGLGYLNGPRASLNFGGDGAPMAITDRARAALDELVASGYAERRRPDDQVPGRESYRGTAADPHLGALAKAAGIDPFSDEMKWTTFEKITPKEEAETLEP